MDFPQEERAFRLISVLRIHCAANDCTVAPRPFHAISFRLSGGAVIADEKSSVALGAGDVFYMPADKEYRLRCRQEEMIAVHFTMDGEKPNRFMKLSPADPDAVQRLLMALYDTWHQQDPGYRLRAMSLFYALLAELHTAGAAPATADPAYRKIQEGVLYLRTHYGDPTLDVRRLCGLCHMSDTYFRRLFVGVYGVTPNKYIVSLRMAHACELLSTGFYSVEDVAEQCGFGNAKYFSVCFRKAMGCSPRQYKKVCQ